MLIAALDNVLLWIIAFITTLDKREGETEEVLELCGSCNGRQP